MAAVSPGGKHAFAKSNTSLYLFFFLLLWGISTYFLEPNNFKVKKVVLENVVNAVSVHKTTILHFHYPVISTLAFTLLNTKLPSFFCTNIRGLSSLSHTRPLYSQQPPRSANRNTCFATLNYLCPRSRNDTPLPSASPNTASMPSSIIQVPRTPPFSFLLPTSLPLLLPNLVTPSTIFHHLCSALDRNIRDAEFPTLTLTPPTTATLFNCSNNNLTNTIFSCVHDISSVFVSSTTAVISSAAARAACIPLRYTFCTTPPVLPTPLPLLLPYLVTPSTIFHHLCSALDRNTRDSEFPPTLTPTPPPTTANLFNCTNNNLTNTIFSCVHDISSVFVSSSTAVIPSAAAAALSLSSLPPSENCQTLIAHSFDADAPDTTTYLIDNTLDSFSDTYNTTNFNTTLVE